MEMLAILLLLFALSGKDGNLKETLSGLIAFYRENREIIQLIAGSMRNSAGGEPAPKPPQTEKDRPMSEVGNKDVLLEFLERRLG